MPDEPVAIAGLIGVLLLSLAWHEAAHAWVADRLGDPTARQLGRVSLNPLRHLDPFLSLILPAFSFYAAGILIGGGKPVPINPRNFFRPARDFMLVALAGPASNLVLAFALTLVYSVSAAAGAFGEGADLLYESRHGAVEAIVGTAILLNVLLALFNLVPIPPLDGSRLILWLLPPAARPYWYRLDPFGLILVIGFLFFLDGFRLVFAGTSALYSGYAAVSAALIDLLGA